MSLPVQHLYEFGPFVLDAAERVLKREGQPVALTPKAFDTLLVLIENNGHIVQKDELMNRVWPDSFVEEGNLAFNISVLRRTLAEGGESIQFIETVPKRGYRFVAGVREILDESPDVVLQRSTTSRIVIEEQRESLEDSAAQKIAARSVSSVRFGFLLSWKVWAVSAVIIIVGAAAYVRFATARGVRTIAVLPFKPLVAGASDESLELGMADAVITRLSTLKQVIVRPTTSVLKYAGSADPIAAGRELGVDSVLDGTVQRSGDTIRLTVRLVRVSDGAPLWADKFDGSFTNIFAVQDSISEKMASALAVSISGDDKRRLAKRYTDNLEAYQDYLKGRYYWNKWNGQALRKSVEYFGQAIDKDPKYALAYSGLSDSQNLLGYLGIDPPRQAFPKSEASALKALELDDTLGEAHLCLGKVKLFYDWNGPGFEAEVKRSLELDPNYADAHSMYGTYLLAIGKFDDSLAERKRGQELDPVSVLMNTGVGWSLFYGRRFDQAIEWYKKALELDPSFVIAHNDLGTCYDLSGMHAEAVAEYLQSKLLLHADPQTIGSLKQAFAAKGIKGYWEKELELASEQAKQGLPVAPFRMARTYTELGDYDRAVQELEKCYEQRNSLLVFINQNPIFERLHSHPGFADLVRRIGIR